MRDEVVFDAALAAASLLVVDDEPGMRHFLQKSLAGKCARVDVSKTAAQASELLDQTSYDVIIIDNIMPGQTGIEWLREQRQVGLHSDVIVITAYADLETAIEALRAGASDFILKPFRSNQVLNAISKCLAKSSLQKQNSLLRHELSEGKDLLRHRNTLIGSSPASREVRLQIETAAQIDGDVVIQGETGLGKEVAARMLHGASARGDKPFTPLQCYGLEASDLRDRLFGSLDLAGDGHEGILRYTEGGVIYFEDVELLDSAGQGILLEWLSTQRFRPVGGSRSFPTDIRVVCSCSEPLRAAVDRGRFHQDLYYLLNVHEIRLPPLRERPEDIVEIADVFNAAIAERIGATPLDLTASAKRKLMAHTWPGNVMELRNIVERALILGSFDGALKDVGPEETESLAAVEQRHILRVLEACGGNRAEAARRLGVARKTIDRKCQAWNI
ncbi:MAG: sigma-54 dependent transcriptional regulator [Pseudomonadota bacterium]